MRLVHSRAAFCALGSERAEGAKTERKRSRKETEEGIIEVSFLLFFSGFCLCINLHCKLVFWEKIK